MKAFGATLMSLALLIPGVADAEPSALTVTRSGSYPSAKGPSEYFTGSVRVDPLFSVEEPSRMAGARVTFEPGARTAWHTHPLGQTLIVTAGTDGQIRYYRCEICGGLADLLVVAKRRLGAL